MFGTLRVPGFPGLGCRPSIRFRPSRRRQQGTTAIELGFLILPFMLLIFGIFELCHSFFVTKNLDNVVERAGRMVKTGVARNFGGAGVGMTEPQMVAWICQRASLPDCTNELDLAASAASSFVDLDLPGVRKSDGTIDPESLKGWSLGAPDDYVLLSAYYTYKLDGLPDLHGLQEQANGNSVLVSVIAFQNEPL